MVKKVKNKDTYKLLHPKIIALITTRSRGEKDNVLACAWMTPLSIDPPLVLICVVKEWYPSELIQEMKEFVINVPDYTMLKEVMIAQALTGRRIDKLQKMGMKVSKGHKVKIDKCIAHLECHLVKKVEAGESYIFIGKVLSAYADESYFDKRWKKGSKIPINLPDDKFIRFK